MFLLPEKDGARLNCRVRKVPYYPLKLRDKLEILSRIGVVGRFNLEYPFGIAEKLHVARACL